MGAIAPPIPKVAPKSFRVIKLLMLITRVLLTFVCSISRNHKWTSCIFVFVQFSKWIAMMYVLYALKLQFWLRSNPNLKVFFITQIGHRPGVSNSKRRPNENLQKTGPQYDCSRAAIWRWRNKGCAWNLLETAATSFFPANDIVSYREFIS